MPLKVNCNKVAEKNKSKSTPPNVMLFLNLSTKAILRHNT